MNKMNGTEELGTKSPLLSVRGLHVSYGAIRAIQGVDLDVYAGEIVSVIGANGAGKSTLLKLLCADVMPSDGLIRRHSHVKIGRYHQVGFL